MVMAVVAFVAAYIGVQYFIARQQVMTYMRENGEAIEDVHIYSIRLTDNWSVWVDWEFNAQGAPEDLGDEATETSLLGLGWTKISPWPGWTSN